MGDPMGSHTGGEDMNQLGESYVQNYIIALSKQLSQINRYVISTRSRGLDGPLHDIQPGDYVYIKTIVGDPFQKK